MVDIPLSWINEANGLSGEELERYINSKCSDNSEMKAIFYEIINPSIYQSSIVEKHQSNSCNGIFQNYLDNTKKTFEKKNIPNWEQSLEHLEGSINSTFRRLNIRKPSQNLPLQSGH